MRIIILEDNIDRRQVMSEVLADMVPNFSVEFYSASRQMIDRLNKTGLMDVAIISLDNDLDMIVNEDGQLLDAGDGIEVARWMSEQPPLVPTIIHTTNKNAGDQIEELLHSNGWLLDRIVPYSGESWIRERWRKLVRNLLVTYVPNGTVSSAGVQILKHGMLANWSAQHLWNQILQLASVHCCDNANSQELTFEFAFLGPQYLVGSIARAGFALLSEVGHGAASEVFEWSKQCVGQGPLSLDADQSLGSEFRTLLTRLSVQQVQLEIVQPHPRLQAMLLVASRKGQFDLNAPQIQKHIRETRNLLELASLQFLSTSKELDLHRNRNLSFQGYGQVNETKERIDE
jgi:CheY-like chemotaxis protein